MPADVFHLNDHKVTHYSQFVFTPYCFSTLTQCMVCIIENHIYDRLVNHSGTVEGAIPSPLEDGESRNGPLNSKVTLLVKKSVPAKIFLVDDHPVVALGLSKLLESQKDLVLSGHAQTAGGIPDVADGPGIDLFIVEILLRTADGFQLLRNLRQQYGESRILVFSTHDEGFYAERALQSGAHGYIMKSESPERILEAIRRVLEGNYHVSGRLQSILFSKLESTPSAVSNPVEKLSNRELQVLQLVGQGRSNREISGILQIRLKTVEAHRFRIKEKLKLKHSAELTQFAIHLLEGQNTLAK